MKISTGPAIAARDIAIGIILFVLTSAVVDLAVWFGHDRLQSSHDPESLFQAFCHYDANHYRSISENGYHYHPALPSEVAFFPAYPLLARLVRFASGWSTDWALLLVSNLCLAGCFVVLHAYVRNRRPDAGPSLPDYAAAAFGLFPTTCFFRFPYSESLFFLTLVALLGMVRRWPSAVIALVIGLATATRPVGIALVPPFALHLWQRSESVKQFAARLAAYVPLACWGLLCYMAYQDWAFGDPLAFAKTQENWRFRDVLSWGEKLWKLLTLEPVWWAFTQTGGTLWANDNLIFSMPKANPVFFLGAVLIVLWGTVRRRLDGREVLLAAGLLLIPYVTRAYDNGLLSMGRFMAVIPALYLVLADWFARLPPAVAAACLTLSSGLLAAYAAQYAVFNFIF